MKKILIRIVVLVLVFAAAVFGTSKILGKKMACLLPYQLLCVWHSPRLYRRGECHKRIISSRPLTINMAELFFVVE